MSMRCNVRTVFTLVTTNLDQQHMHIKAREVCKTAKNLYENMSMSD